MNSENLNILGLVGIRSGSKGIPNKNIRPLAGKPLVGWILNTAMKSNYLNRIMVSTDSEDYAEIARSFGAEVPFLRPLSLAGDKSPDFDYVANYLHWLEVNESYIPDIVVRMMATVPLQSCTDIDAVIKILIKDKAADSAVVISEARQHPLKALKLIKDSNGEEKLVSYFSESGREVNPTARQSYEKAYFRSNVIATRLKTIRETKTLTGDIVRYHIIPQERAIDIDNEIDFSIVEHLMNNPFKKKD